MCVGVCRRVFQVCINRFCNGLVIKCQCRQNSQRKNASQKSQSRRKKIDKQQRTNVYVYAGQLSKHMRKARVRPSRWCVRACVCEHVGTAFAVLRWSQRLPDLHRVFVCVCVSLFSVLHIKLDFSRSRTAVYCTTSIAVCSCASAMNWLLQSSSRVGRESVVCSTKIGQFIYPLRQALMIMLAISWRCGNVVCLRYRAREHQCITPILEHAMPVIS